jgi:nitroreductase
VHFGLAGSIPTRSLLDSKMSRSEIIQKPAETQVPITTILQNRWSPRVFDESHELDSKESIALMEAARWAPSSSNRQPWKFALLLRDSDTFDALSAEALIGFNQTWAPSASALIAVMAEKKSAKGEDQDQAGVFYDAGLASAQIVFQAESMGLKAHYMAGFVEEKAQEVLRVPDVWVVCIIAVGKQGDVNDQPESIQERERLVRDRKELSEIVSHGLN